MGIFKRLLNKADFPAPDHDAALRQRLTDLEYRVTQMGDTEPPYSGKYLNTETRGTYHCLICDAELFSSESKFDPGGAWPAFSAPISEDVVNEASEGSFGLPRTESVCAACGSHLGHVFPDGPGGKGVRYCINSASLRLHEAA